MTGLWGLRAYSFASAVVSAFSVYFLLLTRPLWVLLLVVELMDFMEFKLGFHGHVGPCRICRLGSDIFLVVYIYIWHVYITLVVAGCRWFLCLCCVVFVLLCF